MLAGCLLLSPLAAAQTAAPDPQQLETVEQQLEGSKAEQDRIAAEVAAAMREQDEIASRLIEISAQIQEQEAAIQASEKELQRLAADQVLLMASLGERQEVLSELLAGLQRLEQSRRPPWWWSPRTCWPHSAGQCSSARWCPNCRTTHRN